MSNDDFYVGYLPMPAAHRRALLIGMPLVLTMLIAGIAAMGLAQRDPGDGVWHTGLPATWEGTLIADPFPRLLTDEGSVFLVEFGKVGAQERTEPLVGRRIRASGWLLERDGRRIVELEPASQSPLEDLGPGTMVPASESLGERTLVGEIVDSKCYLGAMKPGDGKAHKACATLCIAGGIPPTLLVRNDGGDAMHFIVVSSTGERADDLFLDLVAEPVRVTGGIERRGDVSFIRLRDVARR